MGTTLMHLCVEVGALGVVAFSLWIAFKDNRSAS
jgi:hypothetical protein